MMFDTYFLSAISILNIMFNNIKYIDRLYKTLELLIRAYSEHILERVEYILRSEECLDWGYLFFVS